MLLGQTTRNDASSDVYSLGIILFELIENRLPFPPPLSQAESDVKIALDIRTILPTMNSSTATAGLKSIVQKCLSFAPGERYASALPLYEDIERESSLRPLLHAPESLISGRIPKLVRRYPRLFSAGPIVLISLLVIGLAMSVAAMGWQRSLLLDAQARLTRFRSESQLLLSELVDPIPSQWDHLLAETIRLTNELLGSNTRLTGSTSQEQFETNFKWLTPEERAAAQQELAEFCITATALTCGSVSKLTPSQRDQLHQLISLCYNMPTSTKVSTALSRLGELVQRDEGELQARYESMMRGLEKRLDAADSADLQPGLIELLQARSDVRNGQARQAMGRLRSIDVDNVPAHLYWMVSGDAQVQLQQLEAAIQSYGLAIGAAPKSVGAFVQRAEGLQQLRIFKSAEADYSAAIKLSPSMPMLYMRRALVRESLGDLDGAIDDMTAALDLEPEANRMLFARARLHQLAGHRDEYLRDFKSGMTATPQVVEDWVSRALAQVARYPQRAKADLQAALQVAPNSLIALQN
jgi:tetratricopeptide (TPR) repeat protein